MTDDERDTRRYDRVTRESAQLVALRASLGAFRHDIQLEGEHAVVDRAGTGLEASVTVRKMSGGIAVERIFPLESPNIDSISVKKKGRIRRAKLYYLRGRTGRKARIREARR